jgi:hypothetical protein
MGHGLVVRVGIGWRGEDAKDVNTIEKSEDVKWVRDAWSEDVMREVRTWSESEYVKWGREVQKWGREVSLPKSGRNPTGRERERKRERERHEACRDGEGVSESITTDA